MLQTGELVSHYRLIDCIGSGGMGAVWKAFDTSLERNVAIKFLLDVESVDGRGLARFKREAKVLASINHPNIVTIHAVDEKAGVPFIVMELAEGRTLAELIAERSLSMARILEISVPLADALGASHEQAVVHGDLKPANIMVTDDDRVKIVDFGLALLQSSAAATDKGTAESSVTASSGGGLAGTLPYMSPEQVRGERGDARSDLFSLGAILFEMATGARAFRGENAGELAAAILRDPPALQALEANAPARFNLIVGRCLHKDPDLRYQMAVDVRTELEELARAVDSKPDRSLWPTLSDRPVATPSRDAMAVLPFRNVTGNTETDYLTDGITEDLINALGQLRGVRVVSRRSAFALKGQELSAQEIGSRLVVDSVLEGAVRQSGRRIRVTVQLTDTRNGYLLWSARYDRELKDVFEIQDEIARSIVSTLEIELSGAEAAPLARRYTSNIEAYQLYLNGRYYWHQQTGEALQHALAYFERALEADPHYAPAHSGIADYYSLLAFWGLARPADVWPRAKEAAGRALDLDDSLAEAHVSLGWVRLFFEWDAEGARREFEKAMRLNPDLAEAHHARALLYAQEERHEKALEDIERARGLDPLSPNMLSTLGSIHYYGRHYDRALEAGEAALELDSQYLEAHVFLGLAHRELGDHASALRSLERASELSGGNPLVLGVLGATLAHADRREEAEGLIEQLDGMSDEHYVAPISQAMVYTGLQQFRPACEYLSEALEARDGLVRYLKVFPIFDPLRGEAEFQALLRRADWPQ